MQEQASGDTLRPTVVLVHGAFADASSWSGVIRELERAGLTAVAPANPLRGPGSDAAYIASVANQIDGPVLLVGHSYGGTVITGAAAKADNVVGLVFITAFAPEPDESLAEIGGRFPDSLLGAALRPAQYPNGGEAPGVEMYLDRTQFPAVFAADLPAEVAAVAAATQRPIALAGLQDKSGAPATWRTLPTWYAVATADKAIHPDAQRFMAQRAGSTTVEIDGSHAVAVSQPVAVADLIRTAAA
jgi:pimeloyl-ACP methyl ester carboxylesterase